ncbi:MAG: SRPBCC domain-containing protein, partial [Candidatus Heimdallarchaeota archaeon]
YFRRRIYVENTSKEELFRKWATPKGLTSWFIARAEYTDERGRKRDPDEVVRPGDSYHWTFHVGSTVEGTVLKVEENTIFSFTFGKNDLNTQDKVVVTALIFEKDGHIGFDILEENLLPSKYSQVHVYISQNMGWMFHQVNLKSLLECNHDLRVSGVNRMHVDAPSGYPLDEYQWTRFRQNEYIKSPRELVFEKWATPKGIVEWFIAEAIYTSEESHARAPFELIEAGDTYTWRFFSGITLNGKILQVKKDEFLQFTFGKKEPNSDEDVIVSVHFNDYEKDQTLIFLIQENIADNEYGKVTFNLSCILGWSYFLTNLRSVLEAGNDLREKDPQIAAESRAYTLSRDIDG